MIEEQDEASLNRRIAVIVGDKHASDYLHDIEAAFRVVAIVCSWFRENGGSSFTLEYCAEADSPWSCGWTGPNVFIEACGNTPTEAICRAALTGQAARSAAHAYRMPDPGPLPTNNLPARDRLIAVDGRILVQHGAIRANGMAKCSDVDTRGRVWIPAEKVPDA